MRPNFLPKGCDYQGRYPEAAHAASEIDEDSPNIAEGLFLWPLVVIAAVAAIGCLVVIWSELMAML